MIFAENLTVISSAKAIYASQFQTINAVGGMAPVDGRVSEETARSALRKGMQFKRAKEKAEARPAATCNLDATPCAYTAQCSLPSS